MHRTKIRSELYQACSETGRETLVNFGGEVQRERLKDGGLINVLDGEEGVSANFSEQYMGQGCCMFPVEVEERFAIEIYAKDCQDASIRIDEIQRLIVRGLNGRCYGAGVKANYEGSSPSREQGAIHSVAYRRIDLMFSYKLEAV